MSTREGFSGADTPSELITVGIKTIETEFKGDERRDVETLADLAASYDVSAILATLRDGADAAGDYLQGSDTARRMRRFSKLMSMAIKELA